MRRRILEDSKANEGGIGSKATPMSVVFANKSAGTLEIVEGDKWSLESHPKSTYAPIGIVVIPGEHGVLKDSEGRNQCGVMSLVGMRADAPTSGGSDQYIYWGQYGTDLSELTNYDSCVSVNNSDQTTPTGSTAYPYITKQTTVGEYAGWYGSPYAPSPYADKITMNSGGFNTAYSDTAQTSVNCLSDFSGIVNTKILTDLATAQNDWRTASAITNTSDNTGDGYSPAACCCARFKTTGTKAFVNCTDEELRNGTGFWYMPAMGELCYIMPRLYDINDTISKLNTAYGVGFQLNTFNAYWSSSESGSGGARIVDTANGRVSNSSKGIDYYVRAFLRL